MSTFDAEGNAYIKVVDFAENFNRDFYEALGLLDYFQKNDIVVIFLKIFGTIKKL